MSLLDKLKETVFEAEEPAASLDHPALSYVPAPPVNLPALKLEPLTPMPDDVALLRSKTMPPDGAIKLLLDTAQSLSAYIPDEDMRFKAALATLARQGVTIPKLEGELQIALTGLETEKQSIKYARAQKFSDAVDTPRARIQEIERQIEQLSQERNVLSAQADSAMREIEKRSEQFTVATATLENQYRVIKRKIGGSK